MAPRLRPLSLASPALATVVALLAGCADGDRLVRPDSSAPTDITDPTALVQAYAEALAAKDVDRYAALLQAPGPGGVEGFRYVRRDTASDEFPWIPWMPESWGYDDEIRCVRRLFGESWDAAVGPPYIVWLEVDVEPSAPVAVTDAVVRVEVPLEIRAMMQGMHGSTFRARLVFELGRDGGGFLRIRRVEEHAAVGETVSRWGEYKAYFL